MENEGQNTELTYFGQIADSYDRIQPIVVGPAYESGLQMVVDLILYEPDDVFQFVELGCGTAELTTRVLRRFPHATGHAVDAEPAMVDLAHRKLTQYGERCKIQQANILDCQLPPSDVVLSSKTFHHVPSEEMGTLLSRISHALRAGGYLIILDHMRVGPRWGESILQQSRRLRRRHTAAAIAAGQATQVEIDARWAFKQHMKAKGKDVEYYHSAEQLLEQMRQSGFAEVGIVWQCFADAILVGFV